MRIELSTSRIAVAISILGKCSLQAASSERMYARYCVSRLEELSRYANYTLDENDRRIAELNMI
jgi:hypothetical protein